MGGGGSRNVGGHRLCVERREGPAVGVRWQDSVLQEVDD